MFKELKNHFIKTIRSERGWVQSLWPIISSIISSVASSYLKKDEKGGDSSSSSGESSGSSGGGLGNILGGAMSMLGGGGGQKEQSPEFVTMGQQSPTPAPQITPFQPKSISEILSGLMNKNRGF